ncbi:MAG: hypothetical protein HY982_00880 [Candidatus Magasanikbacteria bacterium]|nr:hypothetical protein [Candidatus Magasanikbacteria bacterium]
MKKILRKNSEKKARGQLPVMFYHSISSKKIDIKKGEEVYSPRLSRPIFSRERQIWLWGGVITVMGFIIFFWVGQLPAQLKIAGGGADDSLKIFQDSKQTLSQIFANQKEEAAAFKETTDKFLNSLKATAASTASSSLSSASSTLSENQLKELKEKILNKK